MAATLLNLQAGKQGTLWHDARSRRRVGEEAASWFFGAELARLRLAQLASRVIEGSERETVRTALAARFEDRDVQANVAAADYALSIGRELVTSPRRRAVDPELVLFLARAAQAHATAAYSAVAGPLYADPPALSETPA